MNDVSRALIAIEQGDPHAAEQLLPLVYDKLRQLAVQRLAQRPSGTSMAYAPGIVDIIHPHPGT